MRANYKGLDKEVKEELQRKLSSKRSLLNYYRKVTREEDGPTEKWENAMDKIIRLEREIDGVNDEIFDARLQAIERRIEEYKRKYNL